MLLLTVFQTIAIIALGSIVLASPTSATIRRLDSPSLLATDPITIFRPPENYKDPRTTYGRVIQLQSGNVSKTVGLAGRHSTLTVKFAFFDRS